MEDIPQDIPQYIPMNGQDNSQPTIDETEPPKTMCYSCFCLPGKTRGGRLHYYCNFKRGVKCKVAIKLPLKQG